MKNRNSQRGFTVLEGMVALVLMLIGVLGLAGLQVVAVRANHFGKRMSEATALALDLEEQIGIWAYNDSRLASTATLTGPNDAQIQSWDLGRDATTSYQPEYSDLPGDPNVTSTRAGVLATGYQGLQSDVSATGSPDFVRYWNVYTYNDGSSNGLLIQIFVRWKEPNLGYRQITSIAFKVNPAGFQGLL
jgi:type II secretory pathway pseudopilin PulG